MIKKSPITLEESNSMRGVAILFIVIHNLVHLLVPIKENEFAYTPHMLSSFLDSIITAPGTLTANVFSFLGWYGVPVFLFLSGYGLVRKYEVQLAQVSLTFWQFIKSHWIKMLLLMLIPYLMFVFFDYLLYGERISLVSIIKHLCFASNIWPEEINPGVYWYFGLIIQLYACYYLFFYKKDHKSLIALNILSFFLIACCVFYQKNYPLMNFVRHQFIGWILPFTFGIAYARYNWSVVFQENWKNLLLFVLGSVLLVLSNIDGYVWIFSPLIAICLAIYLEAMMKKVSFLNKVFVYVGSISAFLFAIHPVIRHLYWHFKTDNVLLSVSVYVLVSILLSIGYKALHQHLFGGYKK